MKKLLKYWRQNTKKILITIGVIVFLIICIRIANEMVKNSKQNTTITNSAEIKDVTKPNESIISDGKINEKQAEENSQIIKQFVQYCNENNVQEAYNLLSNECKEEIYSTQNIFNENYINKYFNGKKTYQLELWSKNGNSYTYRITYVYGNALQTGGYSSSNNLIDYITIVKQNQEQKLNIGQLINVQNINKSANNNNIEVTIKNKKVYMDYEAYDITIYNNTENTILINDGKTPNNICLVDSDGIKYNSLVHEIPQNILTIEPKLNRTYRIKFDKKFTKDSQIRRLQINEIYLNKEQYNSNQANVEKISVNVDI